MKKATKIQSKVIHLNTKIESIKVATKHVKSPNVVNFKRREFNNMVKDLASITRKQN